MLTPQLLKEVVYALERHEQRHIADYQTAPVAGGDINTSYSLTTPSQRYFIKLLSRQDAQEMHWAEALGLQTIRQAPSLVVPEVIGQGAVGATSFLLLQGLELGGQSDWAALGRGLAEVHRHTSQYFGWPEDNFIGTTLQLNKQSSHWRDFWWQQRLFPQLELAYSNGYRSSLRPKEYALKQASNLLLDKHQPPASLVHGDLWSGNVGFVQDAQPAVFDPACYYGDREVDLAMSKLFGGFSESFYSAYCTAWPLTQGHEQRFVLYNLYHQLNHLNLFGSGYLGQCLHSIEQLTMNRK